MPKYLIDVDWSGYSRGASQYEVEAENEKEAEDNWYSGKKVFHETIRDDTEKEVSKVTKVSD